MTDVNVTRNKNMLNHLNYWIETALSLREKILHQKTDDLTEDEHKLYETLYEERDVRIPV